MPISDLVPDKQLMFMYMNFNNNETYVSEKF